MKKSLIALAVMAAAGAASAQSSVTLFGIVDAAISRYEVKVEGGEVFVDLASVPPDAPAVPAISGPTPAL